MLAYKFRSVEQLHYVLDIIFNNRLYCADSKELNDPSESLYGWSDGTHCYCGNNSEIDRGLSNFRICSLSGTWENPPLWGHYASGFTGVAIAIELPDNLENIKKVEYICNIFPTVFIDDSTEIDTCCKQILFSKNREWRYEQEIRIVHKDQWFNLSPGAIKRIILGPRIDPSLFQMFKIICQKKKIELNKLGIGDESFDLDSVIQRE